MEKIGVIGLGRMGAQIALRLQSQGYDVRGWTRSGKKVDGIAAAPDLPTLIGQSDTLILSLLDDNAVAEVLDVCLNCDLSGKQIIETSTVVPTILQDRITQILEMGATAVDAPISGGPELVAAGDCGVFIGGENRAAARAQTVIEGFSARVFHVGPLGTGLVMKTINNSMLQAYFAGLDDMMPLAKRAGLPLETAMRILCGGPAGLPMLADRLPKILGEDDTVGFAVSATQKDNDVFQRVVAAYGLDAPTITLFGNTVTQATDAGLAESDPAALVAWAYNRD
jgi:3-hydroxyisobutyrate dehydrogenase-like beta-hydroxyacid dehydrogenase